MESEEQLIAFVHNIIAASPLHSSWSAEHLNRLLIPPMNLNQFLAVERPDGSPWFFTTWAFLNEEASTGFVAGTRLLQPSDWDWKPDAELWLIDFICLGDVRDAVTIIIEEICDHYPEVEVAFLARRTKDNRIRRIGLYERPKWA